MSFSGEGSGTSLDPYKIENWHHLNDVRNNLEANFILVNNLDENTDGYADYIGENPEGWDPIGDSGNIFSGVFDANRYTIKDLVIDRSGSNYNSLFSHNGGKIENVYVEYPIIEGGEDTAGLVSFNGGTIENSYVISDYISVQDSGYGGGLVSSNEGTIKHCYTIVTIEGIAGSQLGHLVGLNQGTIVDSMALVSTESLIHTDEGTRGGRVVGTELDGDMKNIRMYTDDNFRDYKKLHKPWNIKVLNRWTGETWHIESGEDYPRLHEPDIVTDEFVKLNQKVGEIDEGTNMHNITLKHGSFEINVENEGPLRRYDALPECLDEEPRKCRSPIIVPSWRKQGKVPLGIGKYSIDVFVTPIDNVKVKWDFDADKILINQEEKNFLHNITEYDILELEEVNYIRVIGEDEEAFAKFNANTTTDALPDISYNYPVKAYIDHMNDIITVDVEWEVGEQGSQDTIDVVVALAFEQNMKDNLPEFWDKYE